MATNYVSEGRVIQHTPSSAIVSGAVVAMSGLLGVALGDIAANEAGSVQIYGVFRLPKVPAAVIGQGDRLTWDVSANAFDDANATPASGDITGLSAVAVKAADNTVSVVDVLLTGLPGTVN
ncbi:MAG: DUF2190 family protein [Pseudomonadota bacterium]